jgi:hypothetical protein
LSSGSVAEQRHEVRVVRHFCRPLDGRGAVPVGDDVLVHPPHGVVLRNSGTVGFGGDFFLLALVGAGIA